MNDSASEEEDGDLESNPYLETDAMGEAERKEVIQTNLQRVRDKDRHEVTAGILSELADQLQAVIPSVKEKNRLLQTQNGDKKDIEEVSVLSSFHLDHNSLPSEHEGEVQERGHSSCTVDAIGPVRNEHCCSL